MNNEAVFIAWGGNLPLATAVAERLKQRGFSPRVGGTTDTGRYTDLYVGHQILAQIRETTSAIVLAQSFTGPSIATTQKTDIRPNLMFEWGYLVAWFRFRPEDLYVYLIDIDRRDLPSDILGSWSETIEFTNWEDTAQKIVDNFCAHFTTHDATPSLAILAKWSEWRNWMDRQIEGKEQPRPTFLARVLLHSIQPAYYHGELSHLADVNKAARKFSDTPALLSARRIVSAACHFYDYTAREQRQWRIGELGQIRQTLAQRLPDCGNSDFMAWLELVRNDFFGLTNYHMAEISRGTSRDNYLVAAEQAFNEGLRQLNNVKTVEKNGVWHLWNGYIRRNLGKVYQMVDRKDDAKRELNNAFDSRQEAYQSLLTESDDRLVLTQVHIETLLVQLDLLSEEFDSGMLSEIGDTFHSYMSEMRLIGLWKQAVSQARRIAVQANDTKTRSILDQLARTLGLKPK
ncbi:TIR domain-containing protein [uncultured Mycobacterium sp.]|uniref:TIR domain-containing protein n=1 Tax=uncultured Mycobacterium sp. TaxID=171292 RepID=UPI0035C9BE73